MKLNKILNTERGFSHFVLMIAFVVVFAIVGVGALVASRAEELDPQPTRPQPISDNTPDDTAPAPKPTASSSSVGRAVRAGAIRANIASTTKSQLGSTNYQKYGGPSGRWCAAFATWVWRSAGVPIPSMAATSSIEQWGRQRNLYYAAGGKYRPRLGDIVIYSTIHTGIVVSSNGKGRIKEIDGNWGNRVSYHLSGRTSGGKVSSTYNNFYTSGQRITGFVSPSRY